MSTAIHDNSTEADELRAKAAEMFPADEYALVENVPVFAEHEADEDGKTVVYDKVVLEKMAANCNARIADTGDFCPLVDRHIPRAADRAAGAPDPKLLAFAGPFRMGQIGEKKPRWAILADYHVPHQNIEEVRNRPRRSIEMFKNVPPEDRFFDPIALLGAETPRLDMGLVYMRPASDESRVRYEASFPSATNAFLPTTGGGDARPRRRNAANNEESIMTPEELQQIVDTVTKNVLAALETKTGGDDPELAQFSRYAADGDADGAKEFVGKLDDDARDRLRARCQEMGPEQKKFADGVFGEAAQYERAAEKLRYERVLRTNSELERRLQKLETDRRVESRNLKLEQLRLEYSFDVDKELKRTATLSDNQFDQHCESIRENYQRIPQGDILSRIRLSAIASTGSPDEPEFTEADRQKAIERVQADPKTTYAAEVEKIKVEKKKAS